MRLKLLAGLSGNDYSLAPGDEHDFENGEADRLINAGFAEKIEDQEVETKTTKRKGKANVVSSEGDGKDE